jgi:hypothetical protein
MGLARQEQQFDSDGRNGCIVHRECPDADGSQEGGRVGGSFATPSAGRTRWSSGGTGMTGILAVGAAGTAALGVLAATAGAVDREQDGWVAVAAVWTLAAAVGVLTAYLVGEALT